MNLCHSAISHLRSITRSHCQCHLSGLHGSGKDKHVNRARGIYHDMLILYKYLAC